MKSLGNIVIGLPLFNFVCEGFKKRETKVQSALPVQYLTDRSSHVDGRMDRLVYHHAL